MEPRHCLNCGQALKGRSDKKFCDDPCRTQHYNKLAVSSPFVRRINHILKKDRQILHDLLAAAKNNKTKVRGKTLHNRGYNFNYHTHTFTSKTGNTYFFCYEYGYLPLENDFYLLVKKDGD